MSTSPYSLAHDASADALLSFSPAMCRCATLKPPHHIPGPSVAAAGFASRSSFALAIGHNIDPADVIICLRDSCNRCLLGLGTFGQVGPMVVVAHVASVWCALPLASLVCLQRLKHPQHGPTPFGKSALSAMQVFEGRWRGKRGVAVKHLVRCGAYYPAATCLAPGGLAVIDRLECAQHGAKC